MKTVWHCGGWRGWNYGDCVLQESTSGILQEHTEQDLRFVYIDNQKTYWSPQLIDKMNQEADMLLIGGGGFVMHREEDNSRSGWQFNIRTEDIKRIQVPIAVYGIGYNKFPYDTHEFPETMWENIQALINHSKLFSVRNWGTYNVLASYCKDVSKVQVVPYAGMFIKSFPYRHECLNYLGLKIGVNWATDRAEQRFGSNMKATVAMNNFFSALYQVAEKYDARVYLIDHLLREKRNEECKDLVHSSAKAILKDRVCIVYEETYEELFPPFDYTAGFFADIYRQMSLVIGMRGHSNIVSWGQNTVPIGLGQHNKVKWFLEDVGMNNIITLQGDQTQIENDVHEKVDDVVNNMMKYKSNMKTEWNRQCKIKDDFMSQAVKLIGA